MHFSSDRIHYSPTSSSGMRSDSNGSTNMIDYRNVIRVVGFDLDQTLYPKSPEVDAAIQGYLYGKIAEHRGVSRDVAAELFRERYREGRGLGGTATLRDLGIPNASAIIQEALEAADIAEFLNPDPTLLALLTEIRERYGSIDLITGSNRSNAEKKLSHLGIPITLFSHLITADDASKSTGEAYELWCGRYPDVAPRQFLYVGDRVRSDYEIPRRLGIETVLVYVKTPDPGVLCPQLASPLELRALLL